MVILISNIDGSQTVSENLCLNRGCSFVLEADGKRCTTVGQRSKLTPKLTPEFYTKCNPRKGFTPVLCDWIKGFGVKLCCKSLVLPKDKVTQWQSWTPCVFSRRRHLLTHTCTVRLNLHWFRFAVDMLYRKIHNKSATY